MQYKNSNEETMHAFSIIMFMLALYTYTFSCSLISCNVNLLTTQANVFMCAIIVQGLDAMEK